MKRTDTTQRTGVFSTAGALLREGARTVRAGGARLIGLMLAFQLVIAFIAAPLITWLFRQALRASGMAVVDFSSFRIGGGLTVTIGLIIVICMLALWIVSLQFALLMLVLRRAQLGEPLNVREILTDLGAIAKKLLRPSSFPLLVYLFVILPLTGFGFTTALAQGIAIPPFISGELMKSPLSSAILIGFLLVLALLNIRLALTVPAFVLTASSGSRSMRISWRLTRGRAAVSLVLAALAVLAIAAVTTLALVITAFVPTVISDEVAPAASPAVAAFSLGIAQVASAFLTAFVTAILVAILLVVLERGADRLPEGVQVNTPVAVGRAHLGPRTALLVLSGATVVAAILLGVSALGTMHRLAQSPDTLVLSHRGFSAGGVENTLSGLEAAAATGADLVEMDVMQSKDGEFIVMHDAVLSRLAGMDVAVKDLTFDELTQITVHDLAGHEDQIPSLTEYATHAAELDIPLLIEIKLGGADTEDHVDRLVAELESIDALERNIYHTLDAASVTRLKELRPDLTVGYILGIAGLGVPETHADFVVVEEWSASQAMQDSADRAGLGFMVWTVNEVSSQRDMLRRNVDGIITDHPDLALAARQEMDEETGLADTLIDALTRFVVVF